MLEQEYSKTTVGIYTRCLRAMFNEAIFQGIIKRDKCYPFGRRKYQCPSSRNIQKALTLDDIGKIYYYEPVCEEERKAKNIRILKVSILFLNELKRKTLPGLLPSPLLFI